MAARRYISREYGRQQTARRYMRLGIRAATGRPYRPYGSSQNSRRGFQPSTNGPSWPMTLGVQTATTSMVSP